MEKIKKPPVPLSLKMIRWIFPYLERALPTVADKLAVNLFFKPFRFKMPAREVNIAESATKFQYDIEGKSIQGYSWGSGEKAVLLMHGWAGRATQFREFIPALLRAGYQVIAIDGPAHGGSTGKSTHLLEFEDALKKLYDLYPQIFAVISHSFGGIATLFAVRNGLQVDKVVTIGCPTVGSYIVEEFLKRINASLRVGIYFEKYILKTLGKSFESFSVQQSLREISGIQLMSFHDKQDREVPIRHAEVLKEAYPKAEIVQTNGLGHMRILRDTNVITKSVAFLDSKPTKKSIEKSASKNLTFLDNSN